MLCFWAGKIVIDGKISQIQTVYYEINPEILFTDYFYADIVFLVVNSNSNIFDSTFIRMIQFIL